MGPTATAPPRADQGGEGAGPLRILLLSNMWPSDADPTFGTFVSRHVAALREAGAVVTVVANERRRSGAAANLRKYVSLLRRSSRAAGRGEYDLVCGHFLYPTAAITRVAARRAGLPYVLVAHGTDVRSLGRRDPIAWASRRALEGAALVVTVSQDLGRRVRGDLQIPPSVPLEVVNMGVDAELFQPDPTARGRRAVPDSERLVLFVGNLIPDKGVDVLLTAFDRLHGRSLVDRLVVVGSGPSEESLRAQAQGPVTFLGAVAHGELPSWMAAADVLVLPSRREGLGLVLLEAMACGTPCVASRVGGIPEILGERCGALVPPEDPEHLAEAIAQVLGRGKEHYEDACRRTALQNTVGEQALRFLRLAERVIRPS
jgi:glycosyltransferase involved in cell wall biosynthesis